MSSLRTNLGCVWEGIDIDVLSDLIYESKNVLYRKMRFFLFEKSKK
jgi:hypothetical protein